jgi:tRNA U54 and U55 pseudouridine synthase Pus10
MYIKELIHGDHGRTRPCVGDLLGCDADILQLDVVKLLPKQALPDGVNDDDDDDD